MPMQIKNLGLIKSFKINKVFHKILFENLKKMSVKQFTGAH